MARKLLCLVALISLVLLTQAPPGFASTIYHIDEGMWTETHGPNPSYELNVSPPNVPDSVPGYANGSFSAFDPVGSLFRIALLR